MELVRPPLVVAFELSEKRKAIVADTLAGASAVVYLTELDGEARAEALRNAGAVGADSEAKHEPARDIDTVVVEEGLTALDPRPIREANKSPRLTLRAQAV